MALAPLAVEPQAFAAPLMLEWRGRRAAILAIVGFAAVLFDSGGQMWLFLLLFPLLNILCITAVVAVAVDIGSLCL